jgi:hypothetical protein
MIEGAIIGVFLLFMGWREWRHDLERRDLYSRLMAKDLTDYLAAENIRMRPPPGDEKRHKNFVRNGLEKWKQGQQSQQSQGN